MKLAKDVGNDILIKLILDMKKVVIQCTSEFICLAVQICL